MGGSSVFTTTTPSTTTTSNSNNPNIINGNRNNNLGNYNSNHHPLSSKSPSSLNSELFAAATTKTTTTETNNNNNKKKTREIKFRAYQAENWTEKFEELLRFRDENGHCLVPNCFPENPSLAQWTKRQRYQHKLKLEGKRSTITNERVRALDDAGFVWDSHKAVWSERFQELKSFLKEYGHCNVPSRYETNHQLAIWVKRQRRQWKNKQENRSHSMTNERQSLLNSIGFVWDMKKKSK